MVMLVVVGEHTADRGGDHGWCHAAIQPLPSEVNLDLSTWTNPLGLRVVLST